jgi:hypothetical protein
VPFYNRAPGAAACLNPVLGGVLAAVDVVVPLVAALVVLCGSAEACDRVFRLLRWIADRPEPPGPGSARRGPARVRGVGGRAASLGLAGSVDGGGGGEECRVPRR